jgi:transposase-like protein
MTCPRCGSLHYYELARYRRYRCKSCGADFTTTSGTIFRDHKLPLAMYRKIIDFWEAGVNAYQISLRLQIQYKTAHRITRLLMKADPQEIATVKASAGTVDD